MDINFHYFAIKTIAICAGLNESDAQKIAGYSQFVDDYNPWNPYYFDSIPEFMKSCGMVKYNTDGLWEMTPTTTGFTDLLDTLSCILESMQEEVITPFHFIPPYGYVRDVPESRATDNATLPADIDGTFLISEMLQRTKDDFLKDKRDCIVDRRTNLLIKIGILLHIFADTYAHQTFSGVQSWINRCYIKEETDNFENDKNITSNLWETYFMLPAIGHTNAGHAPDHTYSSFYIWRARSSADKYGVDYYNSYHRSNTVTFLLAAKQIYTYLFQLVNNDQKPAVDDPVWKELEQLLLKGFEAHDEKITLLCDYWAQNVGKKYNYHYDMNDYWSGQLVTIESSDEQGRKYYSAMDDFFLYNYYAKKIRFEVIGK